MALGNLILNPCTRYFVFPAETTHLHPQLTVTPKIVKNVRFTIKSALRSELPNSLVWQEQMYPSEKSKSSPHPIRYIKFENDILFHFTNLTSVSFELIRVQFSKGFFSSNQCGCKTDQHLLTKNSNAVNFRFRWISSRNILNIFFVKSMQLQNWPTPFDEKIRMQ